ncbi:glycosyl hydrolase family 28-related protein [Sulfitobacter sp. 20_GPM-1509m]|uniref:glycosyl hydrolase family 28-related protein n=1 Tax=Sulfitobacter sp. 20_GPM-1509m TaxID=1380367 RepID=UPI00048B6950|nr:glycosyl hydrolase family 28-related protein [Sulfitobacter sp. 20_GPM-1509m]
MNKAITDGVLLMPPPFANGLDVYSSGDGTPGSDTYASAANAAFVPADQDFAGCLEVQKNASTTKVRYMGETPMLPGCYLRVTVRVKAVSGNLPSVRIAGYAAAAGGGNVPGVDQTGDSVALTTYGEVVEVSAIIGTGDRNGVDLVWGTQAIYGHFGLDLTGPNGGVVRIDDIVIEDVTSVFLRDMLAQVDVRDYGAIGDGTTDDSAAFDAANAAANGRVVLVPAGTYRLNSDVTFDTHVKFEGKVTMPPEAVLLLRRDFHLPAYIDAFEDEEEAFKKAFQALLNNADHESLDMGGRKVAVTAPIDMIATVPSKTSYATRRIIRNGQFEASGTAPWETETITSQATYDPGNATRLDNVVNVANIPVGSLVQGNGVGREVYVRSKNVAQQRITLSAPLFDADGTQNFTFKRFKYLLDFSGFSNLAKFGLDGIEFQCNNVCSGILLAESGLTFTVQDCFISRPKDRGITSHGGGCQGMIIDRCQFLSSEDGADVSDRVSIGFNTNANDVKIRNNRATKFRHWAVIGGGSSIIIGNHFFQGDTVNGGIRSAGIVMAKPHSSGVISGNYIDNCFIEWTNEHDQAPDFSSEFSFSALSITGNTFLSGSVAPWFSYIVVKPHGAGHFLSGVSITANKFRSISGNIDRVERVDTSFADLDRGRFKDVEFHGNSFHGVNTPVSNPLRVRHGETTTAQTWVIDTNGELPFEGWATQVVAVTAHGRLRNDNNVTKFDFPYTDPEEGPNRDQVHLGWDQPMKGTVNLIVRMDN